MFSVSIRMPAGRHCSNVCISWSFVWVSENRRAHNGFLKVPYFSYHLHLLLIKGIRNISFFVLLFHISEFLSVSVI